MFKVIKLKLDSGERLSCVISQKTGVPIRVANRWGINFRRYRVQSSTLYQNLRDISLIYKWGLETQLLDIDQFILSGQIITSKQINSLVEFFRNLRVKTDSRLCNINSFNNRISIAKNFFIWALDAGNRGGVSFLSREEFYKTEQDISRIFSQHIIPGNHSKSHEPLTNAEIAIIQQMLHENLQNNKTSKYFSTFTRYRNLLMFEMALNLGLRKGEILKLRLDCLPRGGEDCIKILRFADDIHDTRQHEPNVKGAERSLRLPKYLMEMLKAYLTNPMPYGRPTSGSPYLLLAKNGTPLSINGANQVIKQIGKISGVKNLCWHRIRHTWAEKIADILALQQKDKIIDNAADILQYLGGWKNPESSQVYIKNAIAKQATEILRNYQDKLYLNE